MQLARTSPLQSDQDQPGRSSETTMAFSPRAETIDNRYNLLEKVGEGASGVVYRANDSLLDTEVAIKILKPGYIAGQEALERVRQEIILSRDIGHPNILRTYHLGEFAGRPYITMQWVEGSTLAAIIADEAPLPITTCIDITCKLASALAAAHQRKILHRDIKPGNILIDRQGEPFLGDFGLARLIGGPGITSHEYFLGTPYYASPEQADLQPLDERSDIYALGLVLFEMVTGRRPFEADTGREVLKMQRTIPPPDPRQLVPSLPEGLAFLILRCLEKDPAQRFASAEVLAAALMELAGLHDDYTGLYH
jgi:serine/threonine-protein kinase